MVKEFPVECILLNCNPLDTTFIASKNLTDNWEGKWGIYPNLGIGEPSPDGVINDTYSDKDFLDIIQCAVELGASIIGGCCGTSSRHIKLLKDIY